MLGFAPIAALAIAATQTSYSTSTALDIATFATGSPTLGLTALNQKHIFVPSFSTGSPSFGLVTLQQKQNLAITAVSIASPTTTGVTLTQKQAVSIATFNTASPTMGPVGLILSTELLPVFNIGSPTFGTVALTQKSALGIAPFSVASPTYGPVALGNIVQSLGIGNFTVGSPTFGFDLAELHLFGISDFSVSSISIPTITAEYRIYVFEPEFIAHADYEFDASVNAEYEQVAISADIGLEEEAA